MRREIYAYVSTCNVCQRMKSARHKPYGLLESLPIPTAPWRDISMDFVTGLPPAKHRRHVYDAILVVVCRYSKMARFIPCNIDIQAPELCDVLCDEIFAVFGSPASIVSDRGSLFTSSYWSTLCYELAIRRRLSTAYHPQTDGQTERTNQTMEGYLRCYVNDEQNDWPMLLASAEYACNNAKNATTQKTPFEVVYTFSPTMRKNIEVARPESTNQASKDRAEAILTAQKQLAAAWHEANSKMVEYYNRKRTDMSFKVGDWVLLSSKNIRLLKHSRKLADRYLGPFRIDARVSATAYRLVLPQKYGRIHPVFHVSVLEKYHLRPGCEPPEPIEVDGEEEHEVEKVLDVEGRGKRRRYLVRWKGWDEAYDSWEPVDALANAQQLIADFEASTKA